MIKPVVLVFFLAFAGCIDRRTDKRLSTAKTRDFGAFSLDIPADWTSTIKKGPDFEILTFTNNDKDTFSMYLGQSAQYPQMTETMIFPKEMEQQVKQPSSNAQVEIVFGNGREIDRNRINNRCFVFETINGLNTRFIFPKDRKRGNARFFVDSLHPDKWQIDFWSNNLTAEKQEAFFKICRTIKPN